MSKELKKIRNLIDNIDKDLISLLNKRARLAENIKHEKDKIGDTDIFRPEREAQILRKLNSLNKGPLSEKHLYIIFREIMSACLSLERKMKVSCLGPEMSYSNLAMIRYFGSSIQRKFSNSIRDIFSDVENDQIDYGVVPIENSSQGSIKETLDQLVSSKLAICGEVNLKIKHCLLSPVKSLAKITTVYAHDQAFLQCNAWLQKNLPNITRKSLSSNSAAVKRIKNTKNSAAIASEYSSLFYGVPVLKKNINDYSDNTTRFIVIGKRGVSMSGVDKTSILVTLNNESGSLLKLIKPLSLNKISMSKIESIPTKMNNWEYMFLIDIDGHSDNTKVKKVLKDIQKNSIFFKVLGSYPVNN